ncbi:type I restriction enzyme HsdR N-terminal domain-containing protein [Amycolatopsis sp. NPDC059021]|uniref:type I restriction enzyme HsdR N-terminal domain-containing protein n=1 Tax=Amycolatopsis sp. NPDC059021 TaxID=3346704 RepID=UPI00366C60C0
MALDSSGRVAQEVYAMDGLEFPAATGSLMRPESGNSEGVSSDAGEVRKQEIRSSDSKVASSRKPVMPKWEVVARERARVAIRRFAKPLNDLVDRDANEGDTRLLVTDFLCEGLGFDKYEDLTTEYQVKGEFADYGVRIDRQMVAFIEVKRCTQKLGVRQLRQVQTYAVNEGVEWMVLTNGQVWQVWHLTGGLPVQVDIALEIDLLADVSTAAKANSLFYLSKEAVKRRLLDDLWKAKAATAPRSLAAVLTTEPVLESVRKEIRRRTNHNSDVEEIERILRTEVVRPELLQG